MADPSPLDYREAVPQGALAHYVRCFWTVRGDLGASRFSFRVLPDGCADLLFDFASHVVVQGRIGEAAQWVGNMTRAILIERHGRVDMFGVRFAPGGLYPLLRLPMADLTDRHVALNTNAPPWAERLHDALGLATTFDHRVHVAHDLLTQVLDTASAPMLRLLAILERRPVLPAVDLLAAEIGFTRRTLERRFLDWVGVTPKQHLRYLRFERALRLIDRAGLSGADVASDLLYSDQSHFINDFRRMAGITPGQHAARTTVLS